MTIDETIAKAVADEREACAKLAETWRDPVIVDDPRAGSSTGCYVAYGEGLECSATQGIADAIRERAKGA